MVLRDAISLRGMHFFEHLHTRLGAFMMSLYSIIPFNESTRSAVWMVDVFSILNEVLCLFKLLSLLL